MFFRFGESLLIRTANNSSLLFLLRLSNQYKEHEKFTSINILVSLLRTWFALCPIVPRGKLLYRHHCAYMLKHTAKYVLDWMFWSANINHVSKMYQKIAKIIYIVVWKPITSVFCHFKFVLKLKVKSNVFNIYLHCLKKIKTCSRWSTLYVN